jgi:CRP-like cAMP-binding protein
MRVQEINTEQMNLYAEMMYKKFFEEFNAPIEAWLQYVERCELVTFKKDEIVKEQDYRERYCYFILNGSIGTFLWNGSNFVCIDFFFDFDFCADYMSLLNNEATPLQLVTLETSMVLRMTATDYLCITKKPVGNHIRLMSAEISFVEKQRQQIELLTKTAEERYRILLNRFPNISNRIAQKHIAAYLGVTPQSLSRIRKSIF